MNISLYNLSKYQTTILKGIAIIMIVLHNFIHYTHSHGENEFDFKYYRVVLFFNWIKEDFLMLINGSFSFFGFLGIELFIFVSAYGLTKQFLKKKPSSYWKYILPKLIKIYGLIILALICYPLFMYPFQTLTISDYIPIVKSYLFLYNNFSFLTLFQHVNTGPWWYFSFIIQLYILFPLLFYVVDKYKEKALWCLLVISYLIIYAITPIANKHYFPIYANFMGHLPEFILGIGFAYFHKFKINYKVFISAFVIFALSNYHESIFPFSFAAATILLLVFFYPIYNSTSLVVKKIFLFLGGISMFMFILNSMIRPYFIDYALGKDSLTILLIALLYSFVVIGISYIVSKIYYKLINPYLDRLIKRVSS